ncbi:MAG: flagellar hook-length control protein FliK [Oscillospiraceae bacterium]|nr:flagellar hook-length control protein FliK [Oscillospiraceae bacterium]
MLQVATQKMNAVKKDFFSKSKTQETDCNQKFEDYLSSITAKSGGSNATSSGKGLKSKKTNSNNDSDYTKSNEKKSSKLMGNTVTSIPNTSQSEEINQAGNTAHSQTETLQNEEDQNNIISQTLPIMPMPLTTVQLYFDDMGDIGNNSLIDARQIASLTASTDNSSAVSSLDLQQVISKNSSIDKFGITGILDSQQVTSTVDTIGSLNTNSLPDAGNDNVNNVQDSVESISFMSVDLNKAEVSVLTPEAIKADFITEDFISNQQISETAIKLQEKMDNPSISNIDVQVDISKNQLQTTGEVATQNVADSTNGNTIHINNDQIVNHTIVSQNMQTHTGTVNDSPQIVQTPTAAEKNVINESEPKAIISKGAVDTANTGDTSDNTEQVASTESQFLGAARVFSGKENDITTLVNKENIVNQVTNSIVTMVKSDNQKFTMELTPETLGKITVEMKYNNGKLEMKISADNTVTAKVLGEKIAELKSSLTANDIDVLNIDISNSSSSSFTNSSMNSNQADGKSGDTGKRQYLENDNLFSDASVSDDNTNANIYYSQNRLLNYLV